jgi:hypothetical protein
MQTKNDSVRPVTSANVKRKKASYQAPELRVYGAVSQWTAGSSGVKGDGGSMTRTQ